MSPEETHGFREDSVFGFYKALAQGHIARLYGSANVMPRKDRKSCKTTSDTTILALRARDGLGADIAVVASDGLVSRGGVRYRENLDKMLPLDRYSVMAGCGYLTPLTQASGILRALLNIFRLDRKYALSAEGKIRQVDDIAEMFYLHSEEFFVPILVTYDHRLRQSRIFDAGGMGSHDERENFWADGSGGTAALEELRSGWRCGMSEQEAIRLAVRAVHRGAHDVHSANQPQHVKIVSALGVKRVPQKTTQGVLQKIRLSCALCKKDGEGGVQ